MNAKRRLKHAICELGHVPWVARVAAQPPARALLSRLPGVRAIYDSDWSRWHPFDRRHGVETSLTKEAGGWSVANEPAVACAHSYAGTQPGPLRAVLRMLPGLQGSTFVDLGCGKGRPLLVATEFPFRAIVGVELAPQLADVARRNAAHFVARYPERTWVQIEVRDAGTYEFPPGDLVLFLYNPFTEAIVWKVVAALDRALAAEPRSVYVIYCNPTCAECFDAAPNLRRLFRRMVPHDVEELGFGPGTADEYALWCGGKAAPV